MLIAQFLRRYRSPLVGGALLSNAGALLTVGLLAQINRLASAGLTRCADRPLMAGLSWLATPCAVNGVSQTVLARLGSSLVAQLRADLAQRFIRFDHHRFVASTASVSGALIQDIGCIEPLMLLAPQFAYNALLALACATYLIAISPPLFVILIIGLAIPLGSSFFPIRTTRRQFDAMRRSEEALFAHFHAISDAKKEMNLNQACAEHFFAKVLTPVVQTAEQTMTRVHLRWGLNQAWSSALTYGAVFAVVYLDHAALHLSAASVMHFVVVGLFIVGPLNFLIQANQQIGTGISSLRNLTQIGLDLYTQIDPATPLVPTDEDSRPTPWQRLHARRLHYHYPNSPPDQGLGPLDLSIRRGELVFIVGANGSGKSTLMLALSGLLPAASGQLYLDGDPVPPGSRTYRVRFMMVFGDFFLFEHVLDARIRIWPREWDLDRPVQVEGDRLSQLKLSTGQRKRLALLQCYAEDRDICLFDEWAADQDPVFREHFYQSLLPELKRRGKTLIAGALCHPIRSTR